MDRWDRLRELEELRDSVPNYLSVIKKFNTKFGKILNNLGLSLDYEAIYLPKDGKRLIESHSYKVSFNVTAIEWSILGLLTRYQKVTVDTDGEDGDVNDILNLPVMMFPMTKGGLFLKEFDFSINVCNECLVKELPQIFLNEDIMDKALKLVIAELEKIDKYITLIGHDDTDTSDLVFRNKGIKRIAISYLKNGKVHVPIKLIKLLSKNLADNIDFTSLHNFKKENPKLFDKLSKLEERLKVGSEMGELGFA